MAINIRLNPYDMFFDLSGNALDDGYIYVGAAGMDPQTNPITCYWDAAGTIVASQPIRTMIGYPERSGAPGIIFSSVPYSIKVKDSAGNQVFYNLSVNPNTVQLASSADTIAQTPGLALDTGNIDVMTLLASQIVSGTFDPARIPGLDASKIITGLLSAVRLPAASNTTQGAIRIATDAEANTGTDELISVNPKQLIAAIGGASGGNVTFSDIDLNPNPGKVTINMGSQKLSLKWGRGSAAPNTTTSVTYADPFTTWSNAIALGAVVDAGAQDNNPANTGTPTSTGFNVFSARDASVAFTWLAWGD